MILIPDGWFWMGSEGRYSWESPRHRVFVSAFRIAPVAVTRREYQTFLEATGHPEPKEWTSPEFSNSDQPAVGMNWFDAVAYCEWISRRLGELRRLPTEAEWEKACRGGTEDAEYAWGNALPSSLPYFHTSGAATGSIPTTTRTRLKRTLRVRSRGLGASPAAAPGGIWSRPRGPRIAAAFPRNSATPTMVSGW
jgi:formylglycine-generating enzyme required for sulfatase activity